MPAAAASLVTTPLLPLPPVVAPPASPSRPWQPSKVAIMAAGQLPVRVFAVAVGGWDPLDMAAVAHWVRQFAGDDTTSNTAWTTVVDKDAVHFTLRPSTAGSGGSGGVDGGATTSYISITRAGTVVFINCQVSDSVTVLDALAQMPAAPGARPLASGGMLTAAGGGFRRAAPSPAVVTHGRHRRPPPLLERVSSYLRASPTWRRMAGWAWAVAYLRLPRPLPAHGARGHTVSPTGPAAGGVVHVRETLEMGVDPSLSVSCGRGAGGAILLQRLDADAVRVIAHVVAQSLHIAQVEARTDGLVEPLRQIARHLEGGGPTTLPSRFLQSVLTHTSSMQADLLFHGGHTAAYTPRPGTPAWNHPARYGALHAALVDELELKERSDAIHRRVEYATSLARTALAGIKDHQLHRLEYWIILILTVELGIKLWEAAHATVSLA